METSKPGPLPRFTTAAEYKRFEAYLDALRKEGKSAAPEAALKKQFNLSASKARSVFAFWQAHVAEPVASAPVEA